MQPKDIKIRIDVIDRSDIVGKLAGFFNPGAISITGVTDMVFRIIAKAVEEGGLGVIYRLNIIGHGNSGVQSVGGGRDPKNGEFIDGSVLSAYSTLFGMLRPYFRADAIVTLHGCNVGSGTNGSKFLQDFSRILGVPVQAGEKTQYPLIPGMEGPLKRCTALICGNPNDAKQKSTPSLNRITGGGVGGGGGRSW